jgi:hypothetical protein
MRARSTTTGAMALAGLIFFGSARAEDATPKSASPSKISATKGVDAYDAVLKAIVKGRLVDYDAAERARAVIVGYRVEIAKADVSTLSKEARLAFYTNAYNAIVLDEVLTHKRPASVLKVDGFFDKTKHVVAGESLTLNELEEKKIRSSGDPRVHFVVNCASDDCPPLAPFAYRAETWERDLEAQTKAYLARPGEVVIDDAKKTITVVQLFEWYRGDFAGDDGVRKFLARYDAARAKTLMDPSFTLAYRPYDWDLNQTR